MTTTEMQQKENADNESPACPYAKALREDRSDSPLASSVSGNSSSLPGLVELKACPAFANECPFKGLGADQVAEKLKEMPPSHLESHGTFQKTLEYFHHHAPLSVAECPVKKALPADFSFDEAMEELSLAAIIANLTIDYDNRKEGQSKSTAKQEPSPSPRTSLSQALKTGTAIAHEAAESVHFVKNFIRGKIDRDLYGLLVAQLFHVYTRLEQALEEHAPTHFAKCHFPRELNRTAALQEDVDFWHTTSNPPVSGATQDYLDRIDYLSNNEPLLLLSHAYTRYLGDLSGGKVLARVARRALNLTADDAGLAFYHFEHVKSFKLFKDQYRASLNALAMTEEQIKKLVTEANVAFLLNMRLFEELDLLDNVPGATVRPLEEVYHISSKSGDGTAEADEKASQQCPFLVSKQASSTVEPQKKLGVCPWPFILLHDPQTGMKQWQTWLVIGLVFASAFVHSSI